MTLLSLFLFCPSIAQPFPAELAKSQGVLVRYRLGVIVYCTTGVIDPDSAIVAADVLSRQALDAQAEDLALEDTLYSLNKALQEGIISAEIYMKQASPNSGCSEFDSTFAVVSCMQPCSLTA